MQTTNNPSTVGCGAPDTLRAAKHHSYGSISLSFPWQGVIDHGPMWDFKMKTAGVFSGGGCRVTERCTRWWNRQAGKDTETRAFTRPRTLRDWRDSIEEPETVDAAALTAAACLPALEDCFSRVLLFWNDFQLGFFFLVLCPSQEKDMPEPALKWGPFSAVLQRLEDVCFDGFQRLPLWIN